MAFNINRVPAALVSLALAGCVQEAPDRNPASQSVAVAPSPGPGGSATSTATSSQGVPSDQATASSAVLVVEGEGLRFFDRATSAASPIPFGRPQRDVLAALGRARGAAKQGTNQDCGAGPVDVATWPDGLTLLFQSGKFAGWGLDRRARGALATAIGIGPGSTRANLEGAYADVQTSQTTLGTEFSAGGFFGLLDGSAPNARVTDMWAGASCLAT